MDTSTPSKITTWGSRYRSGFYDASKIIAIFSIFSTAWFLSSPNAVNVSQLLDFSAIHLLAYVYASLLIASLFSASKLSFATALIASVLLPSFLVADLTALRFFDNPFLRVFSDLPVSPENTSPAVLLATIKSYVPIEIWLNAILATISAVFIANLVHREHRARLGVLTAIVTVLALSEAASKFEYHSDPIIANLVNIPQPNAQPLRYASRDHNFEMSGKPIAKPDTIVMIVVESAGANLRSSDKSSTLSERLIGSSGAGNWNRFPNALTNSNATDVSIPSLLTGSGAHETVEKLHSLPILSQFAKERGYETAFITSSTLDWGGFGPFLRSGHFDKIISSRNSGLPYINDLTVDDHFAYNEAASTITRAKGKLFVLLYVNALHLPFQTTSSFEIPVHLKDRRSRAAYITEAGFDLLFSAIRRSGRMEDAFIILTADHGEFDGDHASTHANKRLQTLDDPILFPMFAIKQPADLSPKYRQAIRRNSKRMVSNLDIAPTLAHMLGGKLGTGLSYSGSSLFGEISRDRIIAASASTEWRQWPSTAIAVSREGERLTCDQKYLCRRTTIKADGPGATRKAGPGDALFDYAQSEPVLRRNLAQIYRDH